MYMTPRCTVLLDVDSNGGPFELVGDCGWIPGTGRCFLWCRDIFGVHIGEVYCEVLSFVGGVFRALKGLLGIVALREGLLTCVEVYRCVEDSIDITPDCRRIADWCVGYSLIPMEGAINLRLSALRSG